MKVIATQGHKSNYLNPISFRKGECLKIGYKDTEYEGWVWVATQDGNHGWAPIQYIQIEEGNNAVARQSYVANELDTQVGEKLILHHELNDWGWVEKYNGSCGWVPMKTIKIA